MRPFLKWAGGKRWLFDSGQISLPEFSGKYIEPFLGGAAAYFHLQPRQALLSDANARLIELYLVVRDEPGLLREKMEVHAKEHCKDYYYQLRGRNFRTAAGRAAQFLYLNRTCWNGLYRENLRGEFNVPIGTKQTVIFEDDDFEQWSRSLRGAELLCQDFEESISEASFGDFIFADPPYTVRHNLNGFVKYNQKIFAWQDQVRLRDALLKASKRGASFAITNADHPSVRNLYRGCGRFRTLHRHSVIAGQSVHRAKSSELLVLG